MIMIQWIVTSLLFLVLIYSSHTIWNYIVERYSTRRVKDAVSSQVEKYKKMVQEIQEHKTEEYALSMEERDHMEQSLTDFTQQLMYSTNSIETTV